MCPFIFKEIQRKPCPGCKIKRSKVEERGHEVIIKECLTEIKNQIKTLKNTVKPSEILLIELYKLKRLTTQDEDQALEITYKKNALEILDIIENFDLIMGSAKQVQFHLDFGDVLFNLEEFEGALVHFILASKKAPQDKRAWNNIAVTKVRQGKVKEALPFYDRALELDPSYGSAWFNKGKALFKMGLKKKALDCFRKATKYSPDNISAWNNLGVTLKHMKRFKESIRCYNKAIKIHSEYPWAWHNKGVALMELKRYKDAMRCFDKALLIDPDYEPARESKKDLMRRLL